VYNFATGIVTRIDPATNTTVATFRAGPGCDRCFGNIAIGEGGVWLDDALNDTITRIDPRTNKVVATIDTTSPGRSSTWVSVTPGAVWVLDYYAGVVSRIDPRTNKMVAVPALSDEPGPLTMSYGAGSLWLCDYHAGLLRRLDPTTLQQQAFVDVSQNQSFGCVTAIALDQAVWVLAKGPEGAPLLIERIDTATNRVSATATPPGSGGGLAADAHGVWYADAQLGLFRLDPQTCKLVAQLPMTDGAGLALGAGSVWFANTEGILSRITPAS
jgi:streptogramin lyase